MVAVSFELLLTIYRRQDAMQEVFFVSFLLALMACFLPEVILLFPLLWLGLGMLRAANLRTILASLLGAAVVVLYGGLAWQIWPEAIGQHVAGLAVCFHRTWGIYVLPWWMQIMFAALVVIAIWAQVALIGRYTTANVRTQTRLLLVTPSFWLGLLSVIVPAQTGMCLLGLLFATSLYYPYLYLRTYGLPRLPSLRHSNPYNRSYKRRRKRR